MQKSKTKKQTVLVTGGSGYIGTRFLESGVLDAYDTVATTREKRHGELKKNVKFECGDLRDEVFIHNLFGDYDFDYIFHLAASEYDEASWDIVNDYTNNCEPLLAMLNFIRKKGADTKLIFLSSINVFGSTKESLVSENTPPIPESFWSSHKLLCHDYCRYYSAKFGVQSNILMLPNTYGFVKNLTLTKRMAVNRIIFDAIVKKEVTLFKNANIKRDFLYIDDVVTALGASLELKNWQAEKFCIADDVHYSFLDLVAVLKTVIPELVFTTNTRDLSDFEMRDYQVSAKKFSSETGWASKESLEKNIIKTCVTMMKNMGK